MSVVQSTLGNKQNFADAKKVPLWIKVPDSFRGVHRIASQSGANRSG
jgi:hypothetical protein